MIRAATLVVVLAACHADARLPSVRPADFAITVREFDGSGMRPVTTIQMSSSRAEVSLSTVPRTIVARFTPSAADLDALYAAYLAQDLEHAAPNPALEADAAEITVEAVVDGRLIRFDSIRPHARAEAFVAVADAIAARAR